MVRTPLRQSSFALPPNRAQARTPYPARLLLYSVVLTFINRHRWWFLATTIAAVLLRLFFVLKMPVIAGDSLVYGDIAKCLINNHMFGIERVSGWDADPDPAAGLSVLSRLHIPDLRPGSLHWRDALSACL